MRQIKDERIKEIDTKLGLDRDIAVSGKLWQQLRERLRTTEVERDILKGRLEDLASGVLYVGSMDSEQIATLVSLASVFLAKPQPETEGGIHV